MLPRKNAGKQKFINNETEFITTVNNKEPWWNVPVTTSSNVPCSRPDIIVWVKMKKLCYVVEFRCPADINIVKQV